MNHRVFLDVLNYLSINFPERTITAELAESYYNDLKDLEPDQLWVAARAWVARATRFPFVAELRTAP